MIGSSESVNTNPESLDSSEQKTENVETDLKTESTEKGLLEKFNFEKLAEKLEDTNLKSTSSFDSEKWTKICKITRNILLANVKQYNTEENKTGSSSLMPVVLSDTLKLPVDFTPSEQMASINLWNMNTLEFISLSSLFKTSNFSLSFKLMDSTSQRPKPNEPGQAKQKVMNKMPPITIQGKQFKYDSAHLISLIQKSQRPVVYDKAPPNDPKQRVLEKFNLKGEVKIPPNWDRKVGYENPTWDMPSSINTGSIFSLGALKNDNKVSNQIDMASATTALKNLSTLVSDFQVNKKTQSEGSSDDIAPLNMNDINNFAFVDDDVDVQQILQSFKRSTGTIK